MTRNQLLNLADRLQGRGPLTTPLLECMDEAADLARKLAALQPVAWRYVPSAIWNDTAVTQEAKVAQIAREYGREVTPLYNLSEVLSDE